MLNAKSHMRCKNSMFVIKISISPSPNADYRHNYGVVVICIAIASVWNIALAQGKHRFSFAVENSKTTTAERKKENATNFSLRHLVYITVSYHTEGNFHNNCGT